MTVENSLKSMIIIEKIYVDNESSVIYAAYNMLDLKRKATDGSKTLRVH
jgi:hypothetical protein